MFRRPTLIAFLIFTYCGSAALLPSPADAQSLQASGPDDVQWVGDKVTLSLRDADLVEVLRSFARLGDLNMILHPGIQGSVTVELKDVPWDQAMSVILQMHGLGLDISGKTVRIGPPDALAEMVRLEGSDPLPSLIPTRRIRGVVKHVSAKDLVRWLDDPKARRLTDRGRVELDPQGRITLEDVPSHLDLLTQLIAALDRPGAERWSDTQLRREAQAWWERKLGSGGF